MGNAVVQLLTFGTELLDAYQHKTNRVSDHFTRITMLLTAN